MLRIKSNLIIIVREFDTSPKPALFSDLPVKSTNPVHETQTPFVSPIDYRIRPEIQVRISGRRALLGLRKLPLTWTPRLMLFE